MDQQFSLSWNNFHGNLSKGFAGLLGSGEFVDVTIAVEGHLLQAHKVILSICSPYFKKMFQMNPCQHPIVVLRDVSYKSMKDLLQFMYHGEVSVKREDLTSFIGTAEVLQIKGLTNKQTEEENIDKDPEGQKPAGEIQHSTPDIESGASDTYEAPNSEDLAPSNDLDLLQKRQLIERLQRFSNLKRKSDEFIQRNFYNTDLYNYDKRIKKDKPVQKNNVHNKYDQSRHACDDSPLDASTNYNTDLTQTRVDKEQNDKTKLDTVMTTDIQTELKTEVEDNDIIVTDPAVCTTPKTFEMSREEQSDIPDYPSPQDNALSLVVNGNHCDSPKLPVRYKYIYSRKGHKQLVHMNFVYTKHSTSHGKTAWRCVQYFSLNRCPATVETVDAMIYATNHQHNHEDCYEKLAKNNIYYEMSEPK